MNFTINQTNGIRETVNSEFINKLYNLFITNRSSHTISLSGYLYSPTGYKAQMDALNSLYGPDLVIEVPASGLYILFHDPEVTNILKTSIGDGEGVAESALTSTTTTNSLGLANNTSIIDFREGCLFTEINSSSTSFVNGCTSLDILGIPPSITFGSSGLIGNAPISKFIIKNWNNWINTEWNGSNFTAIPTGYQFYDMDDAGNISLITHLVLPEGCNFNVGANVDKRRAFRGSGLQEITLPTSMTNVGVFESSSLKYLHFANGAEPTSINERAFSGCSSLEFNVSNLPASITILGWHCFYNCSKITGFVNLPNLTSMAGESFRGSGITGVTDLGSITSISSCQFFGCSNLTSVVLPSSCTSLGDDCFAGCPLTSISDLSNVTTFGGLVFNGLTNLTIPASLLSNMRTASLRTFKLCNITGTLNCPNLTLLGKQCFERCTGITGINSLGNITEIPESCFSGCTGITSIDLSNVITVGNNAFLKCSSLSLVGNLSNVLSIGNNSFGSCSSLTGPLNLTNVSTIEREAFRETHISSVIWSSSVSKIPLGCFLKCGLEYISNLDHVTELSGRCFQGCNLKHVLYLKNVTHTNYYGDLWYSSDAGHTFIGDYMNGSAYALYMPKTIDVFGGNYINSSYSSGFFGDRGRATIPVVYFKELQEIYPASFSNLTCTSLIINNSIPPVWYNANKKADADVGPQETKDKAFVASNITNLYVPDEAISTYENDLNWATLILSGVNILGMSNLTHYATEADWNTAGRPANGIIDAYM